MLRRASARESSRAPACACSAPQHVCSPGTRTSTPLRASTRAVAAFVSENAARITHPVKRATRPRRAPIAAKDRGSRCDDTRVGTSASRSPSRPNPSIRRTRAAPSRRAIAEKRTNPASTAGRGRITLKPTVRASRASGPRLRASSSCERAPSTSFPYSTPDGQAVSHARQSRHWSMCFWKVWPATSTRPLHTVSMRRMRPRGESISTPRTA